MGSLRRFMADRLIGWAYRLDPSRPSARTEPGGGWTVNLGGVPLARISSGQVSDTR